MIPNSIQDVRGNKNKQAEENDVATCPGTVCHCPEVVDPNQISQTRTRGCQPCLAGSCREGQLYRRMAVYLVHGLCILFGKNHVHGVIQLLKLEVARVLAVFLITGIFGSFLGLLHFQGTSWTPAKPFVPLIVVLLIFIL